MVDGRYRCSGDRAADEPHRRRSQRTIRIEIAVVLAVTFGLSAYTALVSLIEAVLLGLSGQKVALNRTPLAHRPDQLGAESGDGVPARRLGHCWACTCCGAAVSGQHESGSADSAGAPTCSAGSGWRR